MLLLLAFVAVCFGLFGALGDGPRAAETPLNFQKDALKIIDVNGHDLDASLSLAVYDVSDGVRKGVTAEEAAEAALFRQQQRITQYLRVGKGSELDRLRAVDTLERLRSMKVAKADRDNIALERRDFSGQKHLHFAHSGTRFGTKDMMRDMVTNVRIALNMKKVGRLDEARTFVKEVVEGSGVENNKLHFTGHSQGGFHAEGVSNDYTGSYATSFSVGSPIIGNGKDHASAYNPRSNKSPMIMRYFQKGDIVPKGRNRLNSKGGTVFSHVEEATGKGFENHRLVNRLPWMQLPEKREKSFLEKQAIRAKWNARKAKRAISEGVEDASRFFGNLGRRLVGKPTVTTKPTKKPKSKSERERIQLRWDARRFRRSYDTEAAKSETGRQIEKLRRRQLKEELAAQTKN